MGFYNELQRVPCRGAVIGLHVELKGSVASSGRVCRFERWNFGAFRSSVSGLWQAIMWAEP